MKKLTILLIVFMIASQVNTVRAEEKDDFNSYGSPTEQEVYENEVIKQRKEKKLSESVMPLSSTNERKQLSVQNFKQETSYWCGPASAKMILKYVAGRTIAQSTFAADMGTNSADGTYVYRLRQDINAYNGINGYYSEQDIYYKPILAPIRTSINDNHPVIARVFTRDLNPAYSFNTGHYVVVTGYNYTWPGIPANNSTDDVGAYATYAKNITYNDPWWDAAIYGSRTVSIDTLSWAINDGTGHGWYIW